ncbi:MAG: hypothetical protein ACERKD_15375 [Prolixibacteraceae bacterium]
MNTRCSNFDRIHLINVFKLIFLLLLILDSGCSSEEIKPATTFSTDYELIEEETDSLLLMAGSMAINLEKIDADFARTKMVNRCIDVWNDMDTTKYVHAKDKVIKSGVYKFDCSGFAGEIVIKTVLPDHFDDLDKHRGTIVDTSGISNLHITRPLAGSMYDYFRDTILMDPDNLVKTNQYWKVFTTIDSLERGDLIIARYNDNWRVKQKNNTTGHVMIAWEIASVNSLNEVNIQVMDATSSGHTSAIDTRSSWKHPVAEKIKGSNGECHNSGIGFGKMTYKISNNEHRRPYAYTWSLKNSKSKWYNLYTGDDISEGSNYDRLEGIIFARPL